MSRYDNRSANRAVALKYDGEGAPVVVASEDNSLATMLSQLALGQEIPDALYQAIVEIYVYFLNFDPNDPDKARRQRQALAEKAARMAAPDEKGAS